MINLSLNELKLVAKTRSIKGYKSISKDRLLSPLNASESVNKSEKNFLDTKSTRDEDYDADEILKTTMPDPANINKTVRQIRKENRDEDKILRDLRFLLDPEKDHYKPVKLLVLLVIFLFNMKALEIKIKIYQSNNILILSDHF